MDGRLFFGILFVLLAVAVGVYLNHKKKLPSFVKTSWSKFKGFTGGLIGAILTLAFALGVILLLWFTWDWSEANVWDRFVDTEQWECREENIDSPEKAIECVNRAHDDEVNQSEIEQILNNPDAYITPESDPDPKP